MQQEVQKKNYCKQLHKNQAICSPTALILPLTESQTELADVTESRELFQERLPGLLFPLDHAAVRFSIRPAVSRFGVSELGSY